MSIVQTEGSVAQLNKWTAGMVILGAVGVMIGAFGMGRIGILVLPLGIAMVASVALGDITPNIRRYVLIGLALCVMPVWYLGGPGATPIGLLAVFWGVLTSCIAGAFLVERKRRSWYQNTAVELLMFFLFPPLGVALILSDDQRSVSAKVLALIALVVYSLMFLLSLTFT